MQSIDIALVVLLQPLHLVVAPTLTPSHNTGVHRYMYNDVGIGPVAMAAKAVTPKTHSLVLTES